MSHSSQNGKLLISRDYFSHETSRISEVDSDLIWLKFRYQQLFVQWETAPDLFKH